jgi:SAM-dependent methyltransferase
MNDRLRLYTDLAEWWPLISPPSDYVEEAADLLPLLLDGSDATGLTLLELGSGGGSLAFHLKDHFAMTLSDRSPSMLDVSREVNPECEHICADMISLDLDRSFDRVLIHDAIMYATTAETVRAALRTAARHCKPGGLVVVLPDCVRETFEPGTEQGGKDGTDGRALRYLEWSWDPDPCDCTFLTAYAFLLKERDGAVRVERDLHECGCFPRADWLTWFEEADLPATIHHDPWKRDVFVGRKGSAPAPAR